MFGALVILLLTLPVLALAMLAVRWRLGKPVFFRQQRIGLRNIPFSVLKLRTMTAACDPSGRLLPDSERLTPLGGFLRTWSIDELPQLWNVLTGEMSLVGPRPLPAKYLPLYCPAQARRHEVKPGITGWAQVCGRNTLTWETRFALDTWYVEHRSFGLDMKILALTIRSVLCREGIGSAGHPTMPEFTGTKSSGNCQ